MGNFEMDSLPTGSIQLWLATAMTSLGPLMALICFVGADRFLRWQLGEKRQRASLEAAEGGEIGPMRQGPGNLSMSRVRRAGWFPVALIASAGVEMLVVIVEAMPIDLLMNMAPFALLSLAAITAIGWFSLQRQSAATDGVIEVEHDRHSG
jgi:hypothetical protein